jgi:hypothetical protein
VGKSSHDQGLADLVREFSTRSDVLRTRWAAHEVRYHRTGLKRIHHPVVGDLELAYEALELPSDLGWTLFSFSAEPGSASDEGLRRLAVWAASAGGEASTVVTSDASTASH